MNDFQYLNKCQHIAISVPHVHMDLGKPQRQVFAVTPSLVLY
jgi:hypothetical protein